MGIFDLLKGKEAVADIKASEGNGIIITPTPNIENPNELKSSEFPLINEGLVQTFPWVINKNPHPTHYWRYFYENPELNALFTAIAEDILSDGFKVVPADGKKSGRNKVLNAEKFLIDNHFKEQLFDFILDLLVTGDAVFYKSGVSRDNVEKALGSIFDKMEIKSFSAKEILDEIKSEDEDTFTARKFLHLPMSTMRADFDLHGDVQYWEQRVAGHKVMFTNEEIIHMRLMRTEGRFYGYTPLYSLQTILDTLKDMRDVLRDDLNGGGIPNSVFMFPGESPNSKNVLAFAKQIKLYALTRHKHKSLIATANEKGMQHIKLRETLKDMEYQNLSKYLTQVLVMVWKVPAKRLSDLLISSGVKGSESDAGYNKQIAHNQDMIEDFVNEYLLKEKGVLLKFNRTYLKDEVTEVTATKIKVDVCEQLLTLGLVNSEFAWDMLDIPEEKKGKGYQEGMGSNQKDKAYATVSSLTQSQEKQKKNMQKQSSQLDNVKSEIDIIKKRDELTEKQIRVMNKLLGVPDAV